MRKPSLRKWLLIAAGTAAVGLGVIGVFVPLLPTTPFLLLAAACFIRSSPRLHLWLINHRWFGNYIRQYRECRAISSRARVVALVVLWGTIGYAALAVATRWWLRAGLAAVAVGVTLHLLHLRTLTPEMAERVRLPLKDRPAGPCDNPSGCGSSGPPHSSECHGD